ncbi:hypothetical protein WOLCODRAFT_65441 [Wolfiporia cocos MD-104 SS10]|uniref:Large ribosomal subunit protein mL54 n=1 Tax=Wolfiporia cocos (strain MD-104) TaxID=742152 RepID=A0A2H3J863_WOLCO|nr:hypothetical protein WOLCODRAFT_65441 [Wolfiporia cocos MD-104 SS10]
MSLLRVLRRPPGLTAWYPARRCYASSTKPVEAAAPTTQKADEPAAVVSRSSCPEGTILAGVQHLKGQPPIAAQPDDAYPAWLWTLLEKKKIPDDGPGGKAEKARLRRENKQRIREQNFMKTQ